MLSTEVGVDHAVLKRPGIGFENPGLDGSVFDSRGVERMILIAKAVQRRCIFVGVLLCVVSLGCVFLGYGPLVEEEEVMLVLEKQEQS